jgi:nitrite reductase/ring-hydroxylating ferredoxin subunit
VSQWHKVASVDEINVNEPFVADVGEIPLALYRLDGEYFAIGDICPHRKTIRLSDGYLVDAAIECPLHQSCFSVRTGKVLKPPAKDDVASYPTRVEDGEIYVEI